MKIQPEFLLIAFGIVFFALYFQARSATKLQLKGAGSDYESKIRTVCTGAEKPDVCIANGNVFLSRCATCVDNPSDPQCNNKKFEIPGGLKGYEGSFSCNELMTKLN